MKFRTIAVCLTLVACLLGAALAADGYNEAKKAYDAAYKLYAGRKYVEGGKAFLAFCKKYPTYPSVESACYYAARCGYYAKDDKTGREAAELCLKTAIAKTNSAPGIIMYAAHCAARQNDAKAAVSLYGKVAYDMAFSSERNSAYESLISYLFRLRDYKGVIKCCDRFNATYPKDTPQVLRMLSHKTNAQRYLNDYDGMAPVIEDIRKLAPDSQYLGDSLSRLAYGRYGKRKYPEAAKVFAEAGALARYTGTEVCWYMVGASVENTRPQDPKKTAAAYQIYVERCPQGPRLEYCWGKVAYFQGRAKEYEAEAKTRQAMDKAFVKSPANAANLWYLANCLLNLKRGDEAIAAAEEVVKRYPEYSETSRILYWLAERYKGKGDKEKAKTYLNQIIDKHPLSPYLARAMQMLKSMK